MFLNTLPTNARQLLKPLGQEPLVRPFYLAGGSAAALHLGHRISADLDFFTPQDYYEAEPLIQQLQTIGHLDIQQQSLGTLVGQLLVRFDWTQIKRFFEDQVKQLMQAL